MTTRHIHQQALDRIIQQDTAAFARLTLFPKDGGMSTLDVPLTELRPHILGRGTLDVRHAFTLTDTDGAEHAVADMKQINIDYHVGRYETTSLAIALSLVDPLATVGVRVILKSGKVLRYKTRITEFLNVSTDFDWFKPHARPVAVKTATGTIHHPNGGRIRRVELDGLYVKD